jgi:cytochrome d ubiquinol oxidase subunit II
MDYIVIAYLWLAILLYLLLGGADFGAGIIELLTSSRNVKRTRKTLYHAIGPIWEANHMWLIIAIVILFVGFPLIYSELSVYLHIPLLIMLMGIIARGTAFVFRHYDAVRDNMQGFYNRIFVWSSFITPLFLGIIAGSVVSGHIDLNADTFEEAYIFTWVNWFSLSVGFFTVSLCGFLASIYLIGEAEDENDKQRFIRKAKNMNLISAGAGAFVFAAAAFDDVPLVNWVFGDRIGLIAVILATLSLFFMWRSINTNIIMIPRLLVGFQVTMILLAISYAHFPNFVILQGGDNLSLLRDQAPTKTMEALGWALLLGSVFILPALFYLYYSFQKKGNEGY